MAARDFAAVPADNAIAQERAGSHSRGRSPIEDGASERRTALVATQRLVTDEGAVGDGERRTIAIADGPAPANGADTADEGFVISQHVAGDSQRAPHVQDAAAARFPRPATFDRQARDGDGESLADVEGPELIAAADGQQAGARPFDVQALLDR